MLAVVAFAVAGAACSPSTSPKLGGRSSSSITQATTTSSPTPEATTPTIPPALSQMTVQIRLSATHAVAGPPINGHLVITNLGPAVDLTDLVPSGCKPGFTVYLTNGTISDEARSTADCVGAAFIIAQGTTMIPFTILTTYVACTSESAETAPNLPLCSSSGMPPLPPGVYQATIGWNDVVPLPKPRPVAVTLIASS